MTVGRAGSRPGHVYAVTQETGLATDDPRIEFIVEKGVINSDLSIGADTTKAQPLLSNEGLACPGVKLHGAGFLTTAKDARKLGLGRKRGLEAHIRPYRNGRDLTAHARQAMVIDLLGLSKEQVRRTYPEVYQHILATVKPERDKNNRAAYRDNWWIFGEPRKEFRPALEGIGRYIATVETAKHRVFQFLDAAILPDNKLIALAIADASFLAMASSRVHTFWASYVGGQLGPTPVYVKSLVFDPFPFPAPSPFIRRKLGEVGEELDALRKRVLKKHPDLTLTGLYNVLEKLKAKAELTNKDEDVKDRGLVLILKELHETIDRLTEEAYGWPANLSDDDVLERLVALNAERAREEASGHVRWLRPDYQVPRFAKGKAAKTSELDFGPKVVAFDKRLPAWPSDRDEHSLAVEDMLVSAGRPMDAATIARGFRSGGKKIERRVDAALHSLSRYGRITALPDGRFVARRAA